MPTRRVGLLGAGGPLGELVAAELSARGIDARLDRGATDPTDRRSLLAFLDGVDVVINATEVGMPVVASAVEAGVAYVDASGDPPFLTDVHRAFRQAQVPVVPACGFECLPGDLAAAVAAEHLGGSCRSVEIHHDRGGVVPTAGEPWDVRFPDGDVKAVAEAQLGERVLVPRHVPGAKVTVTATVPTRGAGLRRLVAARVPALARDRFSVLVVATGETGDRSVVAVLGSGIPGITARLLVTASQAVAGHGAMAPAEALEPEAFLDAVRGRDEHGELEWAFAFPEGSIAPE